MVARRRGGRIVADRPFDLPEHHVRQVRPGRRPAGQAGQPGQGRPPQLADVVDVEGQRGQVERPVAAHRRRIDVNDPGNRPAV